MSFLSVDSYDILIKLGIAMLLGLALGTERIYAHKAAGMRTYSLVAMGAALFVIIAESIGILYGNSADLNPTQIPSAIITGIGFLGAGMIIFRDSHFQGITTASSIWVSAGIGIACGFGFYGLAIIATILTLFIFVVLWFLEQRLKHLFEDNGIGEK